MCIRDRCDVDTLLHIIWKRIEPGTTIIYQSLDEDGFKYLSANHSTEFVDTRTGAHTNAIEHKWHEVSSHVPWFGVQKDHFAGYLAEYLFKAKYPDLKHLHHIFTVAAQLYPPPASKVNILYIFSCSC